MRMMAIYRVCCHFSINEPCFHLTSKIFLRDTTVGLPRIFDKSPSQLNHQESSKPYMLGEPPLYSSTCKRDFVSLVSTDLCILPNVRYIGLPVRLLSKMEGSFPILFGAFVRPFLVTNIRAFSPYL